MNRFKEYKKQTVLEKLRAEQAALKKYQRSPEGKAEAIAIKEGLEKARKQDRINPKDLPF